MAFRWRFLWPLVFTSCCLMALCVLTAVSLFRQQASASAVLRENVASRRAATELGECFLDINALLRDRVESVEPLHARARKHLDEIRALADQPEEKVFSERLHESFAAYLRHWKNMPPPGDPGHNKAVRDAVSMLETNLLKVCEELASFNARRIEKAVEQHEQVLRQLAWGIAGVSGLGGIAGLVLGFGVARGLTQSIRRLQVQIQDAAGQLGGELPAIVLKSEGDLAGLHEQMQLLSGGIEAIVGKLQERERQVLRADQLAALGQLATGVAHEIRNPLTSIKLLVQAGLEDDGSSGLASEDLRVIEQEIRRMERSLNSFLDFARPPRLERRPADILALLESVVALIRGRAEKQGVSVMINAPVTERVTLLVDSEQVKQVLLNLALNALDAMPSGGTLLLTLAPTADGGARIRVSDTGHGIAPEVKPKLFQPFVSSKETGLGIGLVISRRIVENHGATLEADISAVNGAVFTISFPADAVAVIRPLPAERVMTS